MRIEQNWAEVELVGDKRTTRGWMKTVDFCPDSPLECSCLAFRQIDQVATIPILLEYALASTQERRLSKSGLSCPARTDVGDFEKRASPSLLPGKLSRDTRLLSKLLVGLHCARGRHDEVDGNSARSVARGGRRFGRFT
jgi:hypothetical protein